MKLIKFVTCSVLTAFWLPSLAFDAPPKKTVTVRIPEISSAVPESCRNLAEIAYDAYGKEWSANLLTPMSINQHSLAREENRIRAEIDKGRVPASRHLTPQGAVAVFLDYPDLTGTMNSLFINCDKRIAFVSKRGGTSDATRWFGPFKF